MVVRTCLLSVSSTKVEILGQTKSKQNLIRQLKSPTKTLELDLLTFAVYCDVICPIEGTMDKYLRETKILDFSHPDIEELIKSKHWNNSSEYEKIGSIYDFVQRRLWSMQYKRLLTYGFVKGCWYSLPIPRIYHSQKITKRRDYRSSLFTCTKQYYYNDFGVFEDPDSFYREQGSNLSGLKSIIYKHVVRKLMNSNVSRIRLAKIS